MEETCFKAIYWMIISAVALFWAFIIIRFFIEKRDMEATDRRHIKESMYRIEDLLSINSIQRIEKSSKQYAVEKTAVIDEENKVIEDDSNIFLANDIANILRERGITLNHRFFDEPSNAKRLEHIFALVREMLRTY